MSDERFVFLLWHEHDDNDVYDSAKLLGVYSTEAAALSRIQRAKSLPGFEDYPEGFTVARYTVDRDEWPEGFFTIDLSDSE